MSRSLTKSLRSHAALRGLLSVAPVMARDELLAQVVAKFPFYKMPAYRQGCFVSAALEMVAYVPDSRDHILRLLVEKLIKLDAHLSRDHIDEAYRRNRDGVEDTAEDEVKSGGGGGLDPQVHSLDLFMKLMFTYIDVETHSQETGEFDPDKAKVVVDSLMRVFSSHVLPTFNILHTQFLFLYLTSLSPTISARFLADNWKIFTNINTPSILRQTAMAYIASYLSRAEHVGVATLLTYLERITCWTLDYVRTR